jgi:uridine kinase
MMTEENTELLGNAAYLHISHEIIERYRPGEILRVAIDGIDGSGKTCFADNLADYLIDKGLPVIRVSLDDFHNVRSKRYEQGRLSPKGFYEDSYNYEAFIRSVLRPLSKHGDNIYRAKYHNVETDEIINSPAQQANPSAILIVDGIFSNRDELAKYWDYSVFLQVDFKTTFQRMAVRDGTKADPHDDKNRRYHEGQLRYFEECNPQQRASILVDNSDFNNPRIS